ncbi:MAG: ATP synthase F0 subunit B [Kofleriaceae bacterium]|nr:ATP synthase F0 subunit B [Kofleriaceae bacterium]
MSTFSRSTLPKSTKVLILAVVLFAGLLMVSHATSNVAHASGDGAHVPTQAPELNIMDFSYGDKTVKNEYGEDVPMTPPLVLAIFNFLVFVGILYWKAGPALRKYLKERHETIKGALAEAARLQEEAKEKLAEYSERIADADTEVKALIKQIREDAEVERKRIIDDAERQAEQLRKDAEARIESEFLAARRRLEREVVEKATAVAEKFLAEKTTSADHATLFTGFIANLKSSEATQPTSGGAS